MVIRCKKPVEIETGSHCNDSTAFLHPLSKKSRCHFQSPNHGCKHRKQQTICHFSIFPARGRRSTKVKEASLMQITLVVAPQQGHPTTIFGKYLFGRRFAIYNFRNICCKISCLPASPRIFEHLKNGIIAHFKRIFTLKRSPCPRIFGSLFSG